MRKKTLLVVEVTIIRIKMVEKILGSIPVVDRNGGEVWIRVKNQTGVSTRKISTKAASIWIYGPIAYINSNKIMWHYDVLIKRYALTTSVWQNHVNYPRDNVVILRDLFSRTGGLHNFNDVSHSCGIKMDIIYVHNLFVSLHRRST